MLSAENMQKSLLENAYQKKYIYVDTERVENTEISKINAKLVKLANITRQKYLKTKILCFDNFPNKSLSKI